MKKIAIIGANSYIARNVIYSIKKLNESNNEFELFLYDFGDKQVDGYSNYTKLSILDSESIKNIDLSCDIVYMFVGKTGAAAGFDDYNTFIDVNERALLNLLNEYRRQKSKAKIIFPSTRLVYKGSDIPLKENSEKEFKTIYAINKWACENYLLQFHNVFDLKYCIFRICVPYGTLISGASSYGTAEFMLQKAVSGQNISLYGDGLARRTLTYMGDLCNYLIQGGLCEECCNDVYNIGGEDYSLKEMAVLIAKKYKVGIDYIPYPEVAERIESGSTIFNSEKLDKLIKIKNNTKFINWLQTLK